MSDQPPQRPPRPKHVPFWPVAIAIAFMLAVVISGIVASNHARSEKLTVATSTLPARQATTTTTVANSAKKSTTTMYEPTTAAATAVVPGAGSDACTSANLVAAAMASGKVDASALGTISAPQYKCVSGYALARLVPSKAGQQSVTADYELQANKTWKMLNLGEVNPLDDGVPTDIAAQLVLN